MYRQTKSPAESCTFQTERRVVVVDSGNERFFSIRFCSDIEKDVMRHFHAPFGSYPFVSSPNRHWHSSSFFPPRKHRRMRVIIMHTFFFTDIYPISSGCCCTCILSLYTTQHILWLYIPLAFYSKSFVAPYRHIDSRYIRHNFSPVSTWDPQVYGQRFE